MILVAYFALFYINKSYSAEIYFNDNTENLNASLSDIVNADPSTISDIFFPFEELALLEPLMVPESGVPTVLCLDATGQGAAFNLNFSPLNVVISQCPNGIVFYPSLSGSVDSTYFPSLIAALSSFVSVTNASSGFTAYCPSVITVDSNGSPQCSAGWVSISYALPFDITQLDSLTLSLMFGAGFSIFAIPYSVSVGFGFLLSFIRRS